MRLVSKFETNQKIVAFFNIVEQIFIHKVFAVRVEAVKYARCSLYTTRNL